MAYITGMDKTEVSDTATFQVGQKGMDSAGNTFKYVQYDTGAGSVAAVSGQVAYYYAPSGTSAGAVNVVTSDLSDSNEVGAGVLQSAPTDGQYCWIQIGGTATLSIALTAGADGQALTPVGSSDGKLDLSNAVTDPICAFAIDASAKIIACQFAG
tara:strand:+ start:1361 stop:1825 length:465 start_codon:yes stop_codon:yes gene_type:complete